MTTTTTSPSPSDGNNAAPSKGGGQSAGGELKEKNLEEEGGGEGHVASHPRSRRTAVEQGTPSSWAWDKATTTSTKSRRRNIIFPVAPGDETQSHKSAPPPRTNTPTINNLTGDAENSYYTPIRGDDRGGSGSGQKRRNNRRMMGDGASSSGIKSETMKGYWSDDLSLPPVVTTDEGASTQQQHHESSNSFKGWLTAGILDVLNVAAGLTLSTTGTLMAPPIALTRNVLIPSILALIVDTLDNVTPPRVQDWFRILTSSIYHFYTVLSATEKGKIFRQQVLLVIKVMLEAWSSPEARQVVVDGMATSVKLAEALHTPEMLLFLEQSSVLGCRFVDALASGKSKQLIQNSKDLIWKGIELAVDPSTTVALAEVTAHLCQALEEMDHDLTPPPTARTQRNAHNYATYMQTLRMTDYQGESIENIILSSLGVHDDTTANTDASYNNYFSDEEDDDDGGDDDDEGIAVASVPSNVAFHEDATHGSSNVGPKLNTTTINASWKGGERRVNVEQLKDRLLLQARLKARPKRMANTSGATFGNISDTLGNLQNNPASGLVSTKVSVPISAVQGMDNVARAKVGVVDYSPASFPFIGTLTKDMEDAPSLDSMQIGSTNTKAFQSQPNVKELYDRLQHMRDFEEKEPAAIQFYTIIDDLLEQRRRDRLQEQESLLDYPQDPEARGEWKRSHAKIRKLRDGKVTKTKTSSKGLTDEYSNLRRLWKYPPWLLRASSIIVGITGLLWVAFGLYGMYTFASLVYLQGSSFNPIKVPIEPRQTGANTASQFTMPQPNPNEIVIRIVKEVIHVSEDGTKIEGDNIWFDADESASGFSSFEREKVLECIVSAQD